LTLYSLAWKIGERDMKKLNRIVEDRKIAGICGGLGDYFDLDPVFFRLFFLVSLLFGGLGGLAYLILWIMVPEKTGAQGEPRPLKRLHLSGSDRKIGGVCGGLGERFEIDPVLAGRVRRVGTCVRSRDTPLHRVVAADSARAGRARRERLARVAGAGERDKLKVPQFRKEVIQ
jgi:phage shock protein PspC (stress-responsive transcriptional regulator)